jgi:redox-sensitive bicupin YhaK (pirin superfamily)
MSAGTGVVHSESHPSPTERLHLLQIWIMPDARGHTPRYDQKAFGTAARRNVLLPVVSGRDVPGALAIHQDASLYLADLDAGTTVAHRVAPGRRAYAFVTSGTITVNGQALSTGDAATIEHEHGVEIAASAPASLLLMDLP